MDIKISHSDGCAKCSLSRLTTVFTYLYVCICALALGLLTAIVCSQAGFLRLLLLYVHDGCRGGDPTQIVLLSLTINPCFLSQSLNLVRNKEAPLALDSVERPIQDSLYLRAQMKHADEASLNVFKSILDLCHVHTQWTSGWDNFY